MADGSEICEHLGPASRVPPRLATLISGGIVRVTGPRISDRRPAHDLRSPIAATERLPGWRRPGRL